MCFEIHLFSSCYHFTDKEMAATKEKFCLQVPHTLNGEAEIPTQECLTLNPSSIHDSRSDHTWPRCHRPSNISKLNSPYHKWHNCERDTRVLSFLEIFLSPRQTALINTGPLLPARMQLCQAQRSISTSQRGHSLPYLDHTALSSVPKTQRPEKWKQREMDVMWNLTHLGMPSSVIMYSSKGRTKAERSIFSPGLFQKM